MVAPLAARWTFTARQVLWSLVDWVFTPRCVNCRRAGARVCAACRAQIRYMPPHPCAVCGSPQPAGPACPACALLREAGVTALRAVAVFDGPVQRALHALKYQRDQMLADELARWLFAHPLTRQVTGAVVAPVPLSAERLRERGYNQAALLARGLAELTGWDFAPQLLAKVRHTRTQVGLSARERRANVQDAFAVTPGQRVAGRTVVVVDDVTTTGSTLMAVARPLRAGGAAHIYGLTLARADDSAFATAHSLPQ